jgi:hypothetical protein
METYNTNAAYATETDIPTTTESANSCDCLHAESQHNNGNPYSCKECECGGFYANKQFKGSVLLETSPRPYPYGIGMPTGLLLTDFGKLVYEAFGYYPFLVGSALVKRDPRDVDIRLILPDDEYIKLIGSIEQYSRPFTRWAALCKTFSLTGKHMTGLPIDFQIIFEREAKMWIEKPRLLIGK